ncbi:hypothetical protein LINGRAHAP2_LOCUS16697 [Linum grandiflorum]
MGADKKSEGQTCYRDCRIRGEDL